MRTTRRGFSQSYGLPDDVRGILTRRLTELAGLTLLALSGCAAIALASWNVQDPSLNHATSGVVSNVMGAPGAAFSDLMMQLFGVGSVGVVMPVAFWGWRLLAHRTVDSERLRVAMWLAGSAFCAGFAAGFPPTPTWPLPTGLGGVVGDWTFGVPAILFFARNAGFAQSILTLCLGGLAFACLVLAAGFFMHAPAQEDTVPAMPIRLRGEPRLADPDEDEEADGRSASLGAVLHWALSLKHFLTRRRVRGPELVGGRRGRRVGIGDVLARLGREDEADEDMAPPGRRREPPLVRAHGAARRCAPAP